MRDLISRRTVLAAPLAGVVAAPAKAAAMSLYNGQIALEISGDVPKDLLAVIPHWVEQSAADVSLYYGKFPVPKVLIEMPVGPGKGVRGGKSYPGDVPTIEAPVGRASTEKNLMTGDWVMVHEMIHLAFPYLDGEHNWMHEGIAVYVESIARVQAGHLPPEQIWGDFASQMPKGLPEEGDGGFDQGYSWGRTYWGGAMFCLLADIEIRKRTGNAKGLQHALRGINAERDFRNLWPFRETLELGDRATGQTVLIEFYDRMKETPEKPDLAALWQQLGVAVKDGAIVFDGAAKMASIRKALTAPLA